MSPLVVWERYEGDPHRAIQVVQGAVRGHPALLAEPPAQVYVTGFNRLPTGSRRMGLQVGVWLGAPLHMVQITCDLHLAIHDALVENGLELV